MPHSTNPKNRLSSWILLLLALILSGGGFFWHTTQQRQLLDQLDSQLVSMARNVEFFYNKKTPEDNSAQKFLCGNLSEFLPLSDVATSVSVYSPQGKLICTAEKSNDRKQTIPARNIQPVRSATLKATADSGRYGRTLVYPISQNGQTAFYLSINSNLDRLKKQANIFTSVLLLLALFILTGFAILHRRLKNQNLADIGQLTKIMDKTGTEILPPPFTVEKSSAQEIQQLAFSYNEMTTRWADNLRRARQFTADVTHELRTPLTILRGETELALRRSRDPEQLRQVLVSNLEEISRMSYLIEDLLLLSKGDLGEIPLKLEPIPLQELLDELHQQAQLLANSKNITVKLDCPEEQIFLQADSLRLRQVFLNLLTNAIKYTPEDGTVTLELASVDHRISISVIDTGIGIDSKYQEAIFNRFYRVDKTGNRNDGGSGLGLAIVKWIVNAHHGTISVSSIPGQGSKFTVLFPSSQGKPVAESTIKQQIANVATK